MHIHTHLVGPLLLVCKRLASCTHTHTRLRLVSCIDTHTHLAGPLLLVCKGLVSCTELRGAEEGALGVFSTVPGQHICTESQGTLFIQNTRSL